VRIERLKVTLTGESVGWNLWEALKFDESRRVSGWVLYFDGAGHTARRYAFYDAALVRLAFRHDGRGTTRRQAATEVELHFAPPQWTWTASASRLTAAFRGKRPRRPVFGP
jgi:hypothetical protein